MQIEFDPVKDAANLAKHGVSFSALDGFEWGGCISWQDLRTVYPERRECAIGYIGNRLYFVVFTDRKNVQYEARRVISLRKANKREEVFYANA